MHFEGHKAPIMGQGTRVGAAMAARIAGEAEARS